MPIYIEHFVKQMHFIHGVQVVMNTLIKVYFF